MICITYHTSDEARCQEEPGEGEIKIGKRLAALPIFQTVKKLAPARQRPGSLV